VISIASSTTATAHCRPRITLNSRPILKMLKIDDRRCIHEYAICAI